MIILIHSINLILIAITIIIYFKIFRLIKNYLLKKFILILYTIEFNNNQYFNILIIY